MDPEGEAFDYTAQDWRRLIYTFGEKGELIHPRYERGAARRAPMALNLATHPAAEEVDVVAVENKTVHQHEDIKTDKLIDKDDLADRLDSLLDKPES